MDKQRWRRLWFQIHKWIGLVLVIAIIPLSLTGSALVFDETLDRVVNPQRYQVSGESLLPLDRYLAAARTAAPKAGLVANIQLPEGGAPVIVSLSPQQAGGRGAGGPPMRTMVYLDPPSATVLDVAGNRTGLIRTMHMIHGSLMIPGAGRMIVGWIGVFMMVSSFTGLWLWWPMVGKWARGLRWRRHRNTDTNLHYLTGFWVAIPLFVLSLTGAWIAFPAFFGALVGEGGGGRGPGGPGGGRFGAPPLERPALAIQDVLARAKPVAPDARLRTIILPTQKNADWTLAYDTQPMATVTVADDSGTAARDQDRGGNSIARLMRALHDGTGMGPVWRTIIFLGGLIPALLGVTGVIMWWRAKRWRAELKARVAG